MSPDSNQEYLEILLDKNIESFDFHGEGAQQNINRTVFVMLTSALDSGVSDIHIESYGAEARIRFRLGERLYTFSELPTFIFSLLSIYFKNIIGLDGPNRDLSSGGNIKIKIGSEKVQLHVSFFQFFQGEKITIKIFREKSMPRSLVDAGFSKTSLRAIRRGLKNEKGVFILSSPSIKKRNNFIFSFLSEFDRESFSIATIEDKIEFLADGIEQAQVIPEIGLDFSLGLKTLAAEDIDIIALTNMNDAALVNLVMTIGMDRVVAPFFSAKNSFETISRLLNMGVDPSLLVVSLKLIISRSFVHSNCSFCREKISLGKKENLLIKNILNNISEELKKEHSDINFSKPVFFRGIGCPRCDYSGRLGHTAITETCVIDKKLEDMIIKKGKDITSDDWYSNKGIISLQEDGIVKALKGDINIEDVLNF